MEKQSHQEYRDELAEKLKEIRNSDTEKPEVAKAKAQGYLDAKQESKEYLNSKEYITKEREKEFNKRLNEAKLLEIENELSEQADRLTTSIIDSLSNDIENQEPNFSNNLKELVYSMLKLVRFIDLKKCDLEPGDKYYSSELKTVLKLVGNFSGLKDVSKNPEFQSISRQILLQTLDTPFYSESAKRMYTDIKITDTKNVQDRFFIPASYIESSEFQDVLQNQLMSIADNERGWASTGIQVLKDLVDTNLSLSERLTHDRKFVGFVKGVFSDSGIGFDLQKIRDVIETCFHFSESDIKDLGISLIKKSLSYYPVTSRGPAHSSVSAVELYSRAIENANMKASIFNVSEDEMKDLARNRIKIMEERIEEDDFQAGVSKEGYLAVVSLLKRTYSL